MIKVKILNPQLGRNEPTFRPFFYIKDMLRDYSIDITESDDYDFLFVGMADFINKNTSLTESVEQGLENLSKITGDYFLFDGQDSTSLFGAYEVFEQSDAIYLFKNQTLNTRHEYKTPYIVSKWFFGENDLGVSYDIPKKNWDRIKLSGWNLGQLLQYYKNFQPVNNNKNIDICAIYSAEHGHSEEHGIRNDLFYINHRKGAWETISKLKGRYDIRSSKLPFEEYINILYNSKIALSPFGMGEVCFRDFECAQFGTMIIKPNMSKVRTIPNVYVDGETYIAVNYDWSDLEEKIEKVLGNFTEYSYIIDNFRNKLKDEYTLDKLCLHWYNIFKNLNEIEEEN